MYRLQVKTHISWAKKRNRGIDSRTPLCVVGRGWDRRQWRFMKNWDVVTELPRLTKPRATRFTFPGLGFRDCEMRMMVPAPLLGDMRKRSNVFQTVWKKVWCEYKSWKGMNIIVLTDTCWGPLTSTLHASSHGILRAPGGGDYYPLQFAGRETRVQKGWESFPRRYVLILRSWL